MHTADATDIKEADGLHVEMRVLTTIWNGMEASVTRVTEGRSSFECPVWLCTGLSAISPENRKTTVKFFWGY